MKVLWLAGDFWHPAEVMVRGLTFFGNQLDGIEIDMVEDAKDILFPEMLRRYDVIVNAKSNQLTAANRAQWFEKGVTEVMPSDFEEYVREGGGFLSLHAGNMPKDDSGYAEFVGNYFVKHPPRCEVTFSPVGEHPVLEGVSAFTQRDEHYELTGFADDIEVILRSSSVPGGEQIAGYTRLIGEGRLCMLVPGHHIDVWEDPDFQKLLVNALRWCAKKI